MVGAVAASAVTAAVVVHVRARAVPTIAAPLVSQPALQPHPVGPPHREWHVGAEFLPVVAAARPPRLDAAATELGEDPQVWTGEQAAAFLTFADDHPWRALWHLAVGTGARRGELLGLRWQDVNLDQAQVSRPPVALRRPGRRPAAPGQGADAPPSSRS